MKKIIQQDVTLDLSGEEANVMIITGEQTKIFVTYKNKKIIEWWPKENKEVKSIKEAIDIIMNGEATLISKFKY